MQIKSHLLYLSPGTQARFIETSNLGKVIHPIYLVMHYTAGLTASSAINTFKDPGSKVSAHFVIDRNGDVVQMVPTNRRAWHAGVSRWGELTDLNSYSVGIELVNAGKLLQRADGAWLTWSKQIIPAAEVTVAKHQHESQATGWHEYTEAQIESAIAVGAAVANAYEIADVLGHDDVSPGRKVDPGPLFPMMSVRSRILGRALA
tara:strand:+ start:355 stop:966 length:612 start_codon:yes stop_codon:yes gene_type:complete